MTTGGDGGNDASGEGDSFGTMEVGISTQNTGVDRVWISQFELAEPALVNALAAYVGPVGSADATLRGVIYTDAAGAPTMLAGTTNEVLLSGSAAPAWVTLPMAAPRSLAPGTYWLGVHASAQASIAYQSATGATKFASDTYSDGTAATYSGSATTFTMQLSIYATY